MWNQFLNDSRSENKFQNTPLIIMGNKHSGKRSLVDSLFDISKTTIHNKRLAAQVDANKMKLKGLTTAIDYAYLNVIDLSDQDYRTHTKLQVYMIEESQNTSIYLELANKQILKKAVIIIMLDFTNPWSFTTELQKWIKFIYELQKKAEFTISELEQMSAKLQNRYKKFKEPEFDDNGKLKKVFQFEKNQEEAIELPLPDGVLVNNIRIPLIVCVNKCDLQSQVFRDDSTQKIMFVLYHLRKICTQYGAGLVYTSIKNNSNLNLLYEYILSTTYGFPFRFKSEAINEQAIFIPLGYDNNNLINDSVMKMDISRPYQEVIATPQVKKVIKEQVNVEDDSKYFQKYLNFIPSSLSTNASSATAFSANIITASNSSVNISSTSTISGLNSVTNSISAKLSPNNSYSVNVSSVSNSSVDQQQTNSSVADTEQNTNSSFKEISPSMNPTSEKTQEGVPAKCEATNFFKSLLSVAGKKEKQPSTKLADAQKYLEKHTKESTKKKQ